MFETRAPQTAKYIQTRIHISMICHFIYGIVFRCQVVHLVTLSEPINNGHCADGHTLLTLLASPYGKKFPYIFLNSSTERCPLGQSFKNPLYHSWISASERSNKTASSQLNILQTISEAGECGHWGLDRTKRHVCKKRLRELSIRFD